MTGIKTYAALVLLEFATMAIADPAGMIKVSHGDANIERDGKKLAAKVGDTVQSSDRLRTGADGAIGVTLRDETLLSVGPNSLYVLDKFAYDSTTQTGGMRSTLKHGTLVVNTGKLNKTVPDSVEFRTPTTILGARGTAFAIEVPGKGEE